MKKIISCFLLFILIFSLVESVNAYSTNKYSIDIPSSYNKVLEEEFIKENGDSINIKVSSYSGKAPSYNEDTLNEFESMLQKEIISQKDFMIEEAKKKINDYGLSLTEAQINEYVNSLTFNKIDKKELTTCSNNKYDSYHYIASFSVGEASLYIEQYYIVTKNDLYVISLGSYDKNSFSSAETTNMINSFKIINYEKPSSFFSEKVLSKIVATTIITIFFGIIEEISRKNKKKEQKNTAMKESKENRLNEDEKRVIKEEKTIENIDISIDKRFCTKCGNEIKDDWIFCNYCGHKLK